MPSYQAYLAKRQVTLTNSDNEGITYYAGDVLSEWELTDLIKSKIKEGVPYYCQSFEPLTEKEATLYRKKATATEGKRKAPDGQIVEPPWEDYIGLHPKDVIERMSHLSFDDVEKVRQYERAGQNRASIIEYVAPSEREPWHEYDSWSVRDIMEKFDILDTVQVQDAIVYECNHQKRAALIGYEPELEDNEIHIKSSLSAQDAPDEGEDGDSPDRELVGAGAASVDAGGQL